MQGNVYMVANAGANITLYVGDDGVMVVDPSLAAISDKVLAQIERLTDEPIRYLVNTNVDPDHIGANEEFAEVGETLSGRNVEELPIIGHENGLIRLGQRIGTPEEVPFEMWPSQTFYGAKRTMYFNGESIEMLHQPEAYTDADILVYFRRSDVISTGDLYVTSTYPLINLEQGGSVQGSIDALNEIIDITIPERNQQGGTLVIPGHGRISNEADVVQVRDMLTIVRDRIQIMLDQEMTLEEVMAVKPTLEYDGIYGRDSGRWTTRMFIETVYTDLRDRARSNPESR